MNGDGTSAWVSLLGYNQPVANLAATKGYCDTFCDTFTQQPLEVQQILRFNNATQCPTATIIRECYKKIINILTLPLLQQIGESVRTTSIITPELLFDAEREMSNCYYCNHAEEFNAGPATYLNKAAPIMPILEKIGLLYIIIKGTNCYCSYVYGKPTTIFHVAWEKVGQPIVWEKVLKPQLEVLAWERRLINNFVYDKILAPAGNKLQQAGTWTKQKGSQAWDTAKGWFGRKPKAA
jgi:hypothetical protein